MNRKIKKVLIANRGEIAIRIIRTLKAMDIKTVAVHSECDTKAMHVSFADESVCIGASAASESYNNIKNIISAAILTNADAIHPGYGFCSENPKFATIVEKHNMIFVGPTPDQLKIFGDKISAKNYMKEAGLQVIDGIELGCDDVNMAYEKVQNIAFPILLKGVDCGGGRGQRVVHNLDEFKKKFIEAKNEAAKFSSNDKLFIEAFINEPKHIEFQVLGDGQGKVIILGTRDCSVQRKHQKVIEEGPANLPKNVFKETSEKIVKAFGDCKFRSLGTVEFLEKDGKLFFIEVNPRIQVEHPVTEMLIQKDLVQMQIQVAQDEGIPDQKEIKSHGYAIESRINAENPFTFIPSPGCIEQMLAPGGVNIRVDCALYPGWVVPSYYDTNILKLISWGKNRKECINRHKQALNELAISGIETSTQLHHWIFEQEDFLKQNINTTWLENAIKKTFD